MQEEAWAHLPRFEFLLADLSGAGDRQLERMGLIARVQDPAGGRRHLVELTTAGRGRLDDVRQARAQWPATSVQRQDTEDERQLIIAALTLPGRLVSGSVR